MGLGSASASVQAVPVSAMAAMVVAVDAALVLPRSTHTPSPCWVLLCVFCSTSCSRRTTQTPTPHRRHSPGKMRRRRSHWSGAWHQDLLQAGQCCWCTSQEMVALRKLESLPKTGSHNLALEDLVRTESEQAC
eukprot:SAG25_NODE_5747_length_624_cov_1.201905_2_plen_132_part_01